MSSKMPRRFGFLEMLNTSILLSWVSRYGSFYTIQIHSSTKSLKPRSFAIALSWIGMSNPTALMHGKAS